MGQVGGKRQISGAWWQAAGGSPANVTSATAWQQVGDSGLKLELDDHERRAVSRSLAERKARLIERAGDTTQPRAAKRSGLLELKVITSVLRKMRLANGAKRNAKPERAPCS